MKTGRPSLADQDLRGDTIKVRVNAAEHFALDQAARSHGKKLSSWIRDTLLAAAKKKKVMAEPLSMRLSPQSVRRAIVTAPTTPARADGVKPKWWNILEDDCKRCPGKAPA